MMDMAIDFNGLRVELTKNKMTQIELCERAGLRPATVSAMCSGRIKRVPVDAINSICRLLDCQPGDIMVYIPDKTGHTGII